MTAKRLGIAAVVLLALIASGAGAMFWAVQQVPDFYEAALREEEQVDPVARQEEARELVERAEQLAENIKHSDEWSEEFTQQQINSWLAEELKRKYADVIPEGIEDPRIQLLEGGVRLGFRYRQHSWKGVVSAHFKAAVAGPNQLAIQVDVAHAGWLPIPINVALDEVVKHVQDDRWRFEWDPNSEANVLLVSFDSQEVDQGVLQSLELAPGVVRIRGSRGTDQPDSPAIQPESADVGE